MKYHLTKSLLALSAVAVASATAQEVKIIPMPESSEGNAYRLRADDLLTTVVPLPAKVGTTGYPGDDGRIWMSFVRFGINESMLFSGNDQPVSFDDLASATRIVFRTGVAEKAISRQESEEDGGVFADFWFIPNHFTAPGYDLDPLTNNFLVWDAPRHPDAYFVQTFDPTQYSLMPDRAAATIDQFNVEVDITAAVRQAIADGKLTAATRTFSIAIFPNEVEYWKDGAYQPNAPGFAPHRILGLKYSSLEDGGDPAQLELTFGGAAAEWNGFPIGDNDWVDTEGWLGMVWIANDPWIYVHDLGSYIYLPGSDGWAFIPR